MINKEAIHVMESIVYMIKPHYNKDIIEEAVELAIKSLEQTRWIPVSERLPEKPDNYPHCGIYRTYFLVSLASGCVETLGYEFDRDEWQVTGSPVVAWMPLPQPYKAESEEEK